MESEASKLIVKNVKRDKIIHRDIHSLRVITIISRMSQSLLRG
jgi:hypothetical protein